MILKFINIIFFVLISFISNSQEIVDSCFSFDGKGETHDFSDGQIHKSKNIVCSWQSIDYWRNDSLISLSKIILNYKRFESNLKALKCENYGQTLSILSCDEVISVPGVGYSYFYNPKLVKRGLYNTFIALRLTKPLGKSLGIVRIPFMYSALTDYSTFTPSIFTNNSPELIDAEYVGDLKSTPNPDDSIVWRKDTLSIEVKPSQKNHQWLIIYAPYMTHENDIGIFLSPCSHCNEIPKKRTIALDIINKQNNPKSELFKNGKMIIPNISFGYNNFNLDTTQSYRSLDSIVRFLLTNQSIEIRIVGYTDSIGNEQENLKLSEHRAESVYKYIISKGIESTRIQFIGRGKESPLYPNSTIEGRAGNRRVEVEIIK